MFGLFKKKSDIGAVQKYLNEADDNYMAMWKNHDIRPFQPYCGQELLIKMIELLDKGDSIQVGIQKYRHRSWSILDKGEFLYAYRKDTTHDDITLRGALSIPIGDEMHEIWKLQRLDTGFIVLDIADAERMRGTL